MHGGCDTMTDDRAPARHAAPARPSAYLDMVADLEPARAQLGADDPSTFAAAQAVDMPVDPREHLRAVVAGWNDDHSGARAPVGAPRVECIDGEERRVDVAARVTWAAIVAVSLASIIPAMRWG